MRQSDKSDEGVLFRRTESIMADKSRLIGFLKKNATTMYAVKTIADSVVVVCLCSSSFSCLQQWCVCVIVDVAFHRSADVILTE